MNRGDLYLILDNIRSRENVGSIFRTADAVGIKHIYLCGITPTPPHEKIAKTSLGAENYIPWSYIRDTWRIVTRLKKEGISVIGLELTRDSVSAFNLKPKFPAAIVLGNEVKGLSPAILKKCDKKISIPMYGKKESLNVSVAAGIAVYAMREC